MEQSPSPFDKTKEPEAPESAPKPRWSFLEHFGLKPASEKEPKSEKSEKGEKAEKTESNPKKLGEKLLGFLGIKRVENTEKTEDVEQKPSVVDRVVEGAKHIGNSVLRMLGQTRENIMDADAKEPGEAPTNLEPLDKAEDKVENATQELDQAIESAGYSGGDGSGGGNFETPTWKLRAYQEAAAQQTQHEIDKAVEAERKRQEKHNRLHQVGILAAILVGGGEVYTWHKLRQMRKEQKRVAKHSAEQQREILESTRKIEEFERREVGAMDRLERQEYVHEVSAYATSQAEHIEDTARVVRDRLADRPELHPANWIDEEPEISPVSHKKSVIEKLAPPEKVKKVVEQAGEWLSNARSQLPGGSFSGGASHVFGKIKESVARTVSERKKAAAATSNQYSPHDSVQAWLNGTLLLLGIVLIIAIFFAIF